MRAGLTHGRQAVRVSCSIRHPDGLSRCLGACEARCPVSAAPTPLDLERELPPRRGEAPLFRLQRHYARLALKGEYAGLEVTMLLNPPLRVINTLNTPDGLQAHLHELIRDWNLADEDGDPLPLSPASVGELDDDTLTAIMTAWREERDIPKRTKRR